MHEALKLDILYISFLAQFGELIFLDVIKYLPRSDILLPWASAYLAP